MAGFHSNACTYPNCGRRFLNLHDLIHHIEDEHIDFNPENLAAMESAQPTYLPMSYVLKFSSMYPKEKSYEQDYSRQMEQLSIESEGSPTTSDIIHFTEYDITNQFAEDPTRTKRFICLIPGCNKTYKNVNGVKYHIKNSHEGEKSSFDHYKIHKCPCCGKLCKTFQGLRSHMITHHEALQNPHYNCFYKHPRSMRNMGRGEHVNMRMETYGFHFNLSNNQEYLRFDRGSSGNEVSRHFQESLRDPYLGQVPKLNESRENLVELNQFLPSCY